MLKLWSAHPGWFRWFVAGLALAALIVAVPHLAAPDPQLVPGQVGDAPVWLRGLYGDGIPTTGGDYYGFLWLAFIAYLVLVATAAFLPARLLWGVIGGVIIGFTLAPPLLSHDVFSYISYARLGVVHGLNPYAATPSAAPSDPIFAYVGWPHTSSAYGPLFTLFTYPLGRVSVPVALWALKAVAGLSVLGLAWLVARLASVRGSDPRTAAVFVGLNPLVYVHVVGGAHNDGLMTLLLMFGVTALLRERSVAGGAAVVAATAAKLSAAAITPFALIGAANRRSLLLGAAFATAAIAVATASVFNSHALDSISLAAQNQADTSRYSIPATFSRIADVDEGTVRAVALVAYGAGLIWLLVWTARGGDWVRASGWAALGTLLATAWLLPWYVIWVLPLAAISRDRKLTAAVLVLTAFQLLNRVPL